MLGCSFSKQFHALPLARTIIFTIFCLNHRSNYGRKLDFRMSVGYVKPRWDRIAARVNFPGGVRLKIVCVIFWDDAIFPSEAIWPKKNTRRSGEKPSRRRAFGEARFLAPIVRELRRGIYETLILNQLLRHDSAERDSWTSVV